MNVPRFLPALLATLLAAPAWAQSTTQPLNLKLPPGELPAASSTAAVPARDATATAAGVAPAASSARTGAATNPRRDPPGVYYGDTSGRMGNTEVARDARPECDDSTYNQPQVHGSVGMGVVGGSRFSGNYQTGTVNVTKAFGSCDDPGGGMSISIGAGTGRFHGRGH
ncbi:hypothetical protein [Rhodanobacter lindaniclasticus]|uniref:Uncharacterized protein n=1 Tax=Rhodanobacter lindaniclasticus TaxID=75310 RepID=A0A4S3KHC5_9GAMM|nr:hypothetical protein [Rhodanobacter lindaniclasticus]THD08063.1 hypothetical protein B1991_06955 [Rhodanobacter lindaniclasticus]